MKENALSLEMKARKLMKLYSQWHETHNDEIRRKYLLLLGEILAIEPRFSLRREFQRAF